MTRALTKGETPEERELAEKRSRLAKIEAQLTQRELDLHTLRAKLHAFEGRFLQVVGRRLAELDRVRAALAQDRARAAPSAAAQEEALRAAEQAQASAGAADTSAGEAPRPDKFEPSDDLKRLYREAAKEVHPDLATDEDERARRTRIMMEVNRAYEEGNEGHLRAIMEEWAASPEAVTGEGIAAELVRVIRKIAQVERRLEAIEDEIAEPAASDLYELMGKVAEGEAEERDVLAEMAAELDAEIEREQEELRRVQEETIAP